MTDKMRFVIDTNVLLSALLLKDSIARKAFDLALRLGYPIVSEETISEHFEVLNRSRFNRYITQEERLVFLSSLLNQSFRIETTSNFQICRDPKNNI